MYQRLKKYLGATNVSKQEYASIHYLLVPDVNENLIDPATEKLVGVMQKVILLGRVIRDRETLPLRHPLKELVVIVEDYEDIGNAIFQVRPYIFEELNVKQLILTKKREDYGVQMKAKPNFPVLAVKAKNAMKSLGVAIEKMTDAQVQQFRESGTYLLDNYELVLEDIKILPSISAQFCQYKADFDENVIVLLDTTPDQEMLDEGVLRDIVNRIQRLRKEFKIVPTDEIVVYYQVTPADSDLDKLLKKSEEFLVSNIKKPFRPHDKNVKISVEGKSFEVRDILFLSIFINHKITSTVLGTFM